MQRWDIINHFIKKYNYKTYLEIGYYKGWSFDRVECEMKTAVDPNPSKTKEQEERNYTTIGLLVEPGFLLYKCTSDDFFSEERIKYDIIFIDGLHEASQVEKDIQNSLNHLNPGGVIILHDCNPPLYEHTTTGVDGNWTGDTYKAFISAADALQNTHKFYVVDTDWGVGVFKPTGMWVDWMLPHSVGATLNRNYTNDWEWFDLNRENLLHLISVEEFLKREKIED